MAGSSCSPALCSLPGSSHGRRVQHRRCRAAVQLLPEGVYIVMNGLVLDPDKVKKNGGSTGSKGSDFFQFVDMGLVH